MTCRGSVYQTLFSCLLSLSAVAQITIQGGSQSTSSSASSNSKDQYRSQITIEFDMTPEEASRLMASVDEVIAADSKITGLPVRAHVERQVTNRDQIRELTEKMLKDSEFSERAQRSSAVLKKFGFIPRDFNLEQFSAESVVNELAGYYNPKVKTMYLLNWLPASAQIPVMAHELDHALQDQNFQLENWLKTDDPAAAGPIGGDTSEQRAARRAVAEGHATAVMLEYMLAKQGQSLAQLPALTPDLMQTMLDRAMTLPTSQKAPLLLREEMVFPYLYGLLFVQEVLHRAGKEQAYSGIFKRPPESTRQILEPATYLAHEKLASLPMPSFDAVLRDHYEKIESGSIGEFDSMVFVKQFGGAEEVKEIPREWRGDYFYAVRRLQAGDHDKTSAQPVNLGPENVSLLYVSRWANAVAARKFAGFYRTTITRRYSDARPLGDSATHAAEIEAWDTGEGKVTVHVDENLVVVAEGFDGETNSGIIRAVLKADKN